MINDMDYIFKQIKVERETQNNKWGEQNHLPIEWIAILTEEVGEASKEALDYHFKNKPKGDVSLELAQEMRLHDYRCELVQIAAVVVQMIESFDRNQFNELSIRAGTPEETYAFPIVD
jgi:NTP pyrophosphatase (non-canonical NTP hydrolase)